MNPIKDKVAIVGVGHTGASRDAGTSLGVLTVRACREAAADAGLQLKDIDGICTFAGAVRGGPGDPDNSYMIEALGLDGVRWWGGALGGGVGPGILGEAALAVATGQCDYALGYRGMMRPKATLVGYNYMGQMKATGGSQFTSPYGYGVFMQYFASWYQRYRHQFGTTREQLGEFVVSSRENALRNPNAVMQKPLTLDDYMNARWVCEPMSILDCDMPVDACAAVIVTTAERARALKQKPVYVSAVATGQGPRPDFVFWHDYTVMASRYAAQGIWEKADLTPADMDFAEIYDGFSPFIFYWLEDLGFVKRGEAGPFIASGALRMDGALPTNTHGGNLSEGRLHAMGHVVEAALQLQGRAGPRQVKDAEACVVTGGGVTMAGVAVLHT